MQQSETTQPVTATPEKRYLDKQRDRLENELSEARERLREAEAGVAKTLPALRSALDDIAAARLREIDQQGKQALVSARWKGIVPGLTLSGLLREHGSIAGWLAVLVLPFMLRGDMTDVANLMPGWLNFFIWLLLAALSLELEARRRCEAFHLSAKAFGTLVPRLMSVAEHESGDEKYPYSAVSAISAATADALPLVASNDWSMDKKYGSQLGSALLGFGADRASEKMTFAVRLPTGVSMQLMDFSVEAVDPHRATWHALASNLQETAMTHLPTLRALGANIGARDRERGAVALINRRLETLAGVEKNWADVALDAAVLDGILKLVDLFASGRKPAPKGILLYGPPGTGKTLIARKLARHAGCGFKAITISDLKGQHIGETGPKVKEVWAECRKIAPCILFLDECESAFAGRGSSESDSFGAELVQSFLAEWDGFNEVSGQVFVIGATNQHERLDNAIMSRFTTSVLIPAPNAEGRRRIMASEFSKAQLNLVVSKEMVQETGGLSGRDIHTLVSAVLAEHMGGTISASDFLAQARRLRGKSSTNVSSTLDWDDIILPEATRREFQSLGKELRHAEELAAMNISVPRGILLYGPPGTGKTQLARVLAAESGLSFLARSSSELKAGYIGQSGKRVREMFEQARALAPCLLFLDEMDAVFPPRGTGDSFADDMVAQVLQELDGVKSSSSGKVFLLGATNHVDKIDSAILSRLERKIWIDLPDESARLAILRLQLEGKPIDFDLEAALAKLAAATDGKSGRDLQSLVTLAARKAVQRAMLEHGDPTGLRISLVDFD